MSNMSIISFKSNSPFAEFVDTFTKYVSEQTDAEYTLFFNEKLEFFRLDQETKDEYNVIAEISFADVKSSDIEIDEAFELLRNLSHEYCVSYFRCKNIDEK